LIRYSRTSKGNKTLPVLFFSLQEIACKVKNAPRGCTLRHETCKACFA